MVRSIAKALKSAVVFEVKYFKYTLFCAALVERVEPSMADICWQRFPYSKLALPQQVPFLQLFEFPLLRSNSLRVAGSARFSQAARKLFASPQIDSG